MATLEAQNINISVSPVNMEARRNIGIKPGDTVRVWQKIQEKGKTRLQAFEGLVLAKKHGNEAGATFTVRRVSGGVGVEKIFPLYSPSIDKIDIVRRAKVRRAKLYYIREKVAREIKRQMRNMRLMDVTTGSDIEDKEKAKEETQKEAEKDKDINIEKQEEESKESEEKTAEKVSPSEESKESTDDGLEKEKEEKKEEEDKK